MSAMYCALSQCDPDISSTGQWGQPTCLPHPLPHTGPCAPESQSLQRAYSLSPQSTHHGSAYPILLFVREAFSDGKRPLPVLATAGGKTQQEVPAPPKCVQGKAPSRGTLPCLHRGA